MVRAKEHRALHGRSDGRADQPVEPVVVQTFEPELPLVNGAAPATVQGALQRGDRPLWSGNAREVPGVLVQTVLIQSINLGHWLTPLSQSLCTLGAGALGLLVAALLEKRQHKLIAVALIAAVSCPLAYSLAIWQLLLVPLLLPLAAMAATTFSRND